MKATNSYADVFLNEASLIHAQDREVVASWLPAQSKSANGSAEDAPEVAKQVFTVAPDHLGVGASPETADDNTLSGRNSASEQLRQQLLGRKGNYISGRSTDSSPAASAVNKHAQRAKQKQSKHTVESDDTDDEGRSSFIGAKSGTSAMRPAPSDMVAETTTGVVASGNTDTAKQADDTAQHASHAHRESSVNYAGGSSTDKYSMAVKHSGLYLDQILMERSNKKRRKKQHRLGV